MVSECSPWSNEQSAIRNGSVLIWADRKRYQFKTDKQSLLSLHSLFLT